MDTLQLVRVAAARQREAKALLSRIRAERQLLIAQAFKEGHDTWEIARAAGVSRERAYQIRDQVKR